MLKFLRNKMKGILISVAAVFIITMFYGIGQFGLQGGFSQGGKGGEGLAKVNGKDVDVFRFNQIMSRLAAESKVSLDPMSLLYMQSLALSQLIDFTVIEQGSRKSFGAGGDEVDRAVKDIMAANKIPDERTFDKLLKNQGFSLGSLKRMISDEIVVQKMTQKIKGDVKVTPDDMREIRVQHILIKESDKKLAEQVLDKAKKGQDFASLAKEYSIDPGTASNGGDLGFFPKGAMVKEFEDAAFALKPGEISGLVKTPYGYHIIKMDESRLRRNVKQDELLEQKRQNVFNQWFMSLKSKAKVEIKNHLLNAFDKRMKGDNAGAVDEYKKAIKSQPESPYPHLFYADLLTQMKDSSSAMREFENASNLSSADPYVHLYIGKAYLNAAETSEGATSEAYVGSARQEFDKASILAGDNLKVRQDIAAFFKSQKLTKQLALENEKINSLKQRQQIEEQLKKEAGQGEG